MPKIESLFVYPVKSCRGIALERATVDERGIEHDREWMIVDADSHRFITQREVAAMALIATELTGDALRLSHGDAQCVVPYELPRGREIRTEVWHNEASGFDQGDEAAEFISNAIGRSCRLIRSNPEFRRSADERDAIIAFADSFPFLVLSTASLDDLNSRLSEPLPVNRFRPNIVVSGCAPYDEDRWPVIRVNGVRLRSERPCMRCAITATNQETAARGMEPLRTLATYRRWESGVIFAMNYSHLDRGEISVGDEVEMISQGGGSVTASSVSARRLSS